MFKTLRSKTFASKYDGSLCRRCSKPISVGTMIQRAEGFGYEHAQCPELTPTERVEIIAAAAVEANDPIRFSDLREDLADAVADKSDAIAFIAGVLLRCADLLLDEYEAALLADIIAETRPEQRDGVVAPKPLVQKGIYRVSLTGLEKRYGLDYVNVQLTPNPKYGSIKVGEYHGESLGRITREGNFVFWPSYEDRTSTRTQALLAALDIIQGSQDPIEYAKAYAIESGTCFRCGADLVDEKSRERLLGPECFRRFGKGG